MSRKQVVEIKCDRCTRTEYREETPNKVGPTLTIAFDGICVGFDDLCTPCFRAVSNHIEQITKILDSPSPDRVAKSPKSELEAESITVEEPSTGLKRKRPEVDILPTK